MQLVLGEARQTVQQFRQITRCLQARLLTETARAARTAGRLEEVPRRHQVQVLIVAIVIPEHFWRPVEVEKKPLEHPSRPAEPGQSDPAFKPADPGPPRQQQIIAGKAQTVIHVQVGVAKEEPGEEDPGDRPRADGVDAGNQERVQQHDGGK